MKKTIETISMADLAKYPVWTFSELDEEDDVLLPEARLPIQTGVGKIFATKVVFANQDQYWALISNLDENKPELLEHFLTVSLFINGEWFHLARYHDVAFKRFGPAALCEILGANMKEIFPIGYDLSSVFIKPPPVAKGLIFPEPKKKFSEAKLIKLSLS